jgi:D-alanyl-lipoteichoic acid acyltransferase DltB (MBOAT superfamily)
MDTQDNDRMLLELVAQVLIRCFWGGVILLLVWFGAFEAFGRSMYVLHSMMFDITRTQFELINYSAMAATKISIIILFLIPYICLRLVLRKKA